MGVKSVKCECCEHEEDCTQAYIREVKANCDGKWLCGLCAEAVRDEVRKGRKKGCSVEEAMRAHMSFCWKFNANPAVQVADGMRQMLRRRSVDISTSADASKKFGKMATSSQVRDDSSLSLFYKK